MFWPNFSNFIITRHYHHFSTLNINIDTKTPLYYTETNQHCIEIIFDNIIKAAIDKYNSCLIYVCQIATINI